MARSSIEIREIEGVDRWRAVLYGRAMPIDKNPPEWGVDPKFEDTAYRGRAVIDTEPLTNEYPPLSFDGRWAMLHIITGDARVVFEPDREVSSPQRIAEAFLAFARRGKLLEVTWSEGFVVIARWDGFRVRPGRGSDRGWTMKFKVLGYEQPREPEPREALHAGALASEMRRHASKIDKALSEYPPGMAPSFLDRVKESFGSAREGFSRVRQSMAAVGNLARAPAQMLGEITNLAESARNSLREARDQFDETAYEYQVQSQRYENIMRARAWKSSVAGPTDQAMDSLTALIRFAESLMVRPSKYIACKPGDSLARIAMRELGSYDSWTVIANANGIAGDRVPAGVSRLLIPEV